MDILESGIFSVEPPPTHQTQVNTPNPFCESLIALTTFLLFWFFVVWLCDYLYTR